MRQGQQNRRGRGRGRKIQNPLSRNYESNGPDVKIRGNAAHIAEKYSALARDAQAAGDVIMAENFLQHAEHYNRIIMAAQTQNTAQQPSEGANGSAGHRAQNDDGNADARSDDGHDSDENEAEVRAVETSREAAKPNGRSRRARGDKDNAGQQGEPQQDEPQQAEGQPGEDVTESDNAAA